MTLYRKAGLLVLSACIALLSAGCDQDSGNGPDQCLRAQLFEKCMASLPAGPKDTVYNDWAEVVSECETASTYQSYRLKTQIKPECRGR